MKRILSQLVEIAIEMDSSPGVDVSTNDLIGVTQIGPEFLCREFLRKPDYVIFGEC